MKFKKYVCVIVDGYSTGKYIALALNAKGYDCIHIQSSKDLPKDLIGSHKNENYIKNLVFDNNLDFILAQLKDLTIKMCISGSESGIEFADELSEKLKLNSNGTALSKARRNKFLMIEQIKSQGLLTTEHLISDELDEIIKWSQFYKTYPVVLKPLESASGDGVYICKNESEIEKSFHTIINKKNLFGDKNTKVLAEQYIDGEEYIVNTVSWEGHHYLAEIWHIIRVPQTTIYDKCELIDNTDEKFLKLKEYAFGVLNALGIHYGAGSTEVRYTTKGPVVIECAARLMGGAELGITRESIGQDQLSLMLEAYLEPEKFLQRIGNDNYRLNFSVVAVLLISTMSGKLQKELDASFLLRSINTLFSLYIDVKKNDSIQPTDSLMTCPGTVYLMGENTLISEDVKKIRDYEKNSFYKNAVAVEEAPRNELIQNKFSLSSKQINIASNALFALSIFAHTSKKPVIKQAGIFSSILSLCLSFSDRLLSGDKMNNKAILKMLFSIISKGLVISSLTSENKKLPLVSACFLWLSTAIAENFNYFKEVSQRNDRKGLTL